MKYLSFLLISFTLYAQYPYPDTVFMYNDKVYPCLMTDFSDTHIEFLYSNSIYESVILESILKIKLDGFGEIYNKEAGYIASIDSLKSFVQNRWEKFAQKEKASKDTAVKEEITSEKDSLGNRWSFGVFYIPYYSAKIYDFVYEPSYPDLRYITSTIYNETNMEGQFSYLIAHRFRATLDISYTLNFTEERDETHQRIQEQGYNYDSGILNSEDLKLFDFTIGFKYYFKDFLNEKVNAYMLGGIGKQIAFATVKEESLFTSPQPGTFSENNREDYLEDLNSPWHFNIGFGAEYFFNESLSLFSSIRMQYSTINAKYDSRSGSSYQVETSTNEYSNSDITTRVGLGLNFYF
ncbi:MAG TPA: hypothetical protein VMT35_01415 [Ignavibacteriaceae bacterium]|nr:hypothetical protein [Ignavibacteriaceae bacterium]